MTYFYVATLARSVVIKARNSDEARRCAEPFLKALYAEVGIPPHDLSRRILTVRVASEEEIEAWQPETDPEGETVSASPLGVGLR